MSSAHDKASSRIHRRIDFAQGVSSRADDASNEYGSRPPGDRERFAPRLLLLSLFLGTLAAMYFLYPKAYIENNLRTHPQPDATTLAYLQLLVRVEPKNERLRLLLVREALAAGQLSKARTAFAPWEKVPVSQLPFAVALAGLQLRLVTLQASRANAANRTVLTDQYVEEVLALAPRMQPADLLKQARVVQAIGGYSAAAEIDRRIINESTDSRTRKIAFHDGIKALLAANRPAAALAFAESEISRLTPDEELWRLLTRLALSANRPVIAAKYARRLVGMQSQ